MKNFIIHIDDIEGEQEKQKSFYLINKYIDAIEGYQGEIEAAVGYKLYIEYIKPLIGIYLRIGFKKNHPLKFQLMYSVTVDIFLGAIFERFPYPIATAAVLLYYFIISRRERNSTKFFSIFY